MFKKILVVAGALALASCAQIKHTNLTRTDVGLVPERAVFIEIPKDGEYGTINYLNSSSKLVNMLRGEFIKHSSVIEVCAAEACNAQLEKNQDAYLVKPKILHWEDRETQWSFRPDVVEIQLSVIDMETGKEVRSTIYRAKSRVIQFFAGTSPEDILERPTREAVASFYL
ncbi:MULTISPECIES: DUF4823 domain-containing protein [unclassified Shewanella]|uniref:DUF4823 domain-containing protein n=1 Tax=unclassified Shewanella TaxID=196818 RepID=UPI001BC2F3B4|nr:MULTISPECIES: DUF4823 domain-containing protein [unclassified Shewanella]GIU05207.1 hypothetical protein TUM4444_01190 [Shewanella sp. MBTL60-112-B1]GIU24270.1 hypothetical protein TUM4445_01180 [Shewanella sp. MBTL60-112-B2]